MTTANVYNMKKEKVGEIDLPDSIFAVGVKKALLHEAVCAHLSNTRHGNASTKTRAEVRGGGKKPWRQKGTGRARHGSNRSPIWVGGGVTFGPRPRDWHIEMPKKQKKLALKMALSLKNSEGKISIVDAWTSANGKTKEMVDVLNQWGIKSGLILSNSPDKKTQHAIRNIPHVKILRGVDMNIYDILQHEHLIITKEAVKRA